MSPSPLPDPAAASGDATTLLPLLYDELRRLAAAMLAHEKPGQTLEATGLVHEVYMRLVGATGPQRWHNPRHFFGTAAETMRRILVENARRKKAKKRGNGMVRHDAKDLHMAAPEPAFPAVDLIALDEALIQLAKGYPDAAEVAKLKHFAGLTDEEVANALGISESTAKRLWQFARAMLYQSMEGRLPEKAEEKSQES